METVGQHDKLGKRPDHSRLARGLARERRRASEFSDDAWSRRVANVTPQHVGRLRRVFERFAAARGNYPGLYWSHFQAAPRLG